MIILEGAECTWKSTVAKDILDTIDVPCYRALRDGKSWTSEELTFWGTVGVPANTYVEDFYIADLSRKGVLKDVVLDRSMPSGLAYDDTMWRPMSSYLPRGKESVDFIRHIANLFIEVNGLEELDDAGDKIHFEMDVMPTKRCLKCLKWWCKALGEDATLVYLYGDVDERIEAMKERGRGGDTIDVRNYRLMAYRVHLMCLIAQEYGIKLLKYDIDRYSESMDLAVAIIIQARGGYQLKLPFQE